MKIEIITHHTCAHCRRYAELARKYAEVVEYDISVKPAKGVPYSRLYDNGTLIAEWQGATLQPLFDFIGGPKMRVRFSITCRDKYTGETYKKGAIRSFPDKRAKELIAEGVAVEVKARKNDDGRASK